MCVKHLKHLFVRVYNFLQVVELGDYYSGRPIYSQDVEKVEKVNARILMEICVVVTCVVCIDPVRQT